MSATYLLLAPEFGGTRFGPFDGGPIAFGSDAAQCAIVLPAQMGIHPVHAWLTPLNPHTWVLQPAVGGAGLFAIKGAMGAPLPVSSSAQLGAGDSLVLGNPQGPRFTIEAATGSSVVAARSGMGGRRPPTAAQMGQEVRRQASTYAMSRGPLGPLLQFFYRVRTGTFLQPRYIVGALVAIVAASVTACGGLLTLLLRHL